MNYDDKHTCAHSGILLTGVITFKLRVRKKINQGDYLYLLQCSVSDCSSNFNQIENEKFVGERNVCSSAAAAAAPGVVTEIKNIQMIIMMCCSSQTIALFSVLSCTSA